MEYGHHVHPHAQRVYVSDSGYGLAQPFCAFLGVVQFVGERILRVGFGTGFGLWRSGDIQHRPGAQFTSKEFTGTLIEHGVAISMDGRGRALDNAFIERLWWSVKYEDVYPKVYGDGAALYRGLNDYFRYYNEERRHSAIDKKTPAEVYFGK